MTVGVMVGVIGGMAVVGRITTTTTATTTTAAAAVDATSIVINMHMLYLRVDLIVC